MEERGDLVFAEEWVEFKESCKEFFRRGDPNAELMAELLAEQQKK